MRVYLAGEMKPAVVPNVQRRLFSYYYHGKKIGNRPSKDVLNAHAMNQDLFLDCGAFTAHNQGVPITVDEYAQFVSQHGALFTCVSSLDDTHKDEQLSYDNLKALERLGCKNLCPVFHTRENPKWLQRYIEEGYPYIFIGGMVPETTKWLFGWLDELWDKYLTDKEGRPLVKIHGFGLTVFDLIQRYPWFSVDSSSWLQRGAYGSCAFLFNNKINVVTFSEKSPALKDWKSKHFENLSLQERNILIEQIGAAGLTVEELSVDYIKRDIWNAFLYQKLEDCGTAIFKKRQGTLFGL